MTVELSRLNRLYTRPRACSVCHANTRLNPLTIGWWCDCSWHRMVMLSVCTRPWVIGRDRSTQGLEDVWHA